MLGEDYKKMHRISTKEAAAELNLGVDSLQYLMQQNRLPIGFAAKKPKALRYSYYIYRESLDSYKEALRNGTVAPGMFGSIIN